mgnify:CR=1 FL=1
MDPDAEGQSILGLQLDGGELQRLAPTATKDEQTATLNSVIDRLNALLKTQIYSDGQSKRLIIGYQKDGWGLNKDFGIKVSIEGVDVTKATDEQLLIKFDLETWFYYEDGIDVGQVGKLPNGRSGEAWSKDGESVSGAFGA